MSTVIIGRLIGRLLTLLHRSEKDRELDEELRYHLSRQAEQYLAEGVSPDQAHSMALRDFGGLEKTRELCNEARGVRFIEDLTYDIHLGWRRLWKTPAFAVVAILTLSLGVGANSTLFALVNGVMFKPLSVIKPGQLYKLGNRADCFDCWGIFEDYSIYSYPLYRYLHDSTPQFTEMAAFSPKLFELGVRRSGDDQSIAYKGEFVSGNYFQLLGIDAYAAGRALAPGDDQPDAQAVAIISYRTWQQCYHSDVSLVGSILLINTQPVKVIGVAPPGFFGAALRPESPDFWFPIAIEPKLNPNNSRVNQSELYWLFVIGRLQSGARPAQVQDKLTAGIQRWLTAQQGALSQDVSQISKAHVILTSAGNGVNLLPDQTMAKIRLHAALSVLVLLITCITLGNLLLTRTAANRLQIAVCTTLGASRWRLLRQVLTEGVLLSLLGGLVGLALSILAAPILLSFYFRDASYIPIDVGPSLAVLLCTFFISLSTGVVFSIAPAWLTSLAQPIDITRGAGRSKQTGFTFLQKALVVLQAALSLILLVSAGLLIETLQHLNNQRIGFDTENRVIVWVDSALAGYTPESVPGLYQHLQDRLNHIPEVQSASLSLSSPMYNNYRNLLYFSGAFGINGEPPPGESNGRFGSQINRVSAQYFETLGTRLMRGRAIDEHDTRRSPYVAVINETFARKYFPRDEPLGKRIKFFTADGEKDDYKEIASVEVIGVVEDTQYIDSRLQSVPPALFLPLLQPMHLEGDWFDIGENYVNSIQLHVAKRSANLETDVRRALADIDPNLVVLHMASFEDQVRSNFDDDRLVTAIATIYGFLIVFLSAVGLYGVVSYSAMRRMKEVAIHLALGAQSKSVIFLLLREALMPVALGLVIGIPAALAAGYAIKDHLYGVKNDDLTVLTIAILILAASAMLASIAPAIRATFIDPVRVLKTE